MGIYESQCQHKDAKKVTEGIRKCVSCGMLIITDRGVDKRK